MKRLIQQQSVQHRNALRLATNVSGICMPIAFDTIIMYFTGLSSAGLGQREVQVCNHALKVEGTILQSCNISKGLMCEKHYVGLPSRTITKD